MARALDDYAARLMGVRPSRPPSFKQLHDRIGELRAAGRAGEAAEIARILRDAYPDHPKPWLALASALDAAGESEAAAATARAAVQRFGQDAPLLNLAARLVQDEDPEAAVGYLERLAHISTARAEIHMRIAALRLAVLDGPGALEALVAAEEAGAPRESLELSYARAAMLMGDLDTAEQLLTRLASGPRAAEAAPWMEKLKLRRRQLARRSPRARTVPSQELQGFAAELGLPVGTIDEDGACFVTEAGDLLLRRVEGSKALLLIFGGLALMAGGELSQLEGPLQRAGVSHLLMSDPQRLFLLGGLPSVGDYPATIAWLRRLAAAWGAERIYCLGYSAGGYAALRYGLDLRAHRVLTFAAPTTLDIRLKANDRRATALVARLQRLVPEMMLDLRSLFQARGADAPEAINYFAENMPEDAWHARLLEGLPTVRLEALAGSDSHAVVAELKAQGRYEQVLADFLRDA